MVKVFICIGLFIIMLNGLLFCNQVCPQAEQSRAFRFDLQDACAFTLALSNFGYIGGGDDVIPNAGLIFPPNSGINYLYQGALWIGATKYRRNAEGVKLYWLAQHPSEDSSGVVAEDSPGWDSSLHPVVDTLTTVGFDGDLDLYELLPAYNPLASSNPALIDLYPQFNAQDNIFKSLDSYPMPRSFEYPDPLGTYCFTISQETTDTEPAFETCSGYYYDFCPFGTLGDRDWGSSQSSSHHYPLGLAIEQESYAWPLEIYDHMVIFKYVIHNTSPVDTLFDLAISYYLDSDAGPLANGSSAIGTDDVSGYIMGNNYEFAYSRDFDGDNGQTPGWLGCKLILPESATHNGSYYWHVGDGPDDTDPRNLSLGSASTANEKYWLQTGRNPSPGNMDKFQTLRGGPTGTVVEYEQPNPCDTRFLLSGWGNRPTPANRLPTGRLNLLPNQSVDVYMALFPATSLEGLKGQSIIIESLCENNFVLSGTTYMYATPYITSLEQTAIGNVECHWFCYNDPSYFELQYRAAGDTTLPWQNITLGQHDRSGVINELPNLVNYEFRVLAAFYPGPLGVYPLSPVRTLLIDDYNPNQDEFAVPAVLYNYPNPFSTATGTIFKLDPADKSTASLTIYIPKANWLNPFPMSKFTLPGVTLPGPDAMQTAPLWPAASISMSSKLAKLL